MQHLWDVTDREKGGTPGKKPEPQRLYPLQILHGLAWNESRAPMSRYTKDLFQCCPSNDKFPWMTEYRLSAKVYFKYRRGKTTKNFVFENTSQRNT